MSRRPPNKPPSKGKRRPPNPGGSKRSRGDRLPARSGPSGAKRRDHKRHSSQKRYDSDLVKGRHAVEALVSHQPKRVRALYHWGRSDAQQVLQAARASDIPVVSAPPDDEMANDHLAQGLAAKVRPYRYLDLDELAPDDRVERALLVLDGVTPHNLGAILRSAAFFAFDGVILPRDRSASVNPAVERISRGATAIVPIAQVTNIARTISTLRDRGYLTVVTTLSPDAVPLADVELRAPIALVLGGEGRGARRLVVQKCELQTTVPALGPMQSLNVASFATLIMAAARGFRGRDSA